MKATTRQDAAFPSPEVLTRRLARDERAYAKARSSAGREVRKLLGALRRPGALRTVQRQAKRTGSAIDHLWSNASCVIEDREGAAR